MPDRSLALVHSAIAHKYDNNKINPVHVDDEEDVNDIVESISTINADEFIDTAGKAARQYFNYYFLSQEIKEMDDWIKVLKYRATRARLEILYWDKKILWKHGPTCNTQS